MKTFSIPFADDLVIRDWHPRDLPQCISLISSALEEHNLQFEASNPDSPDYDVLHVNTAYHLGEFWVIEDLSTGSIVGTSAFHPMSNASSTISTVSTDTVEIRKMYLRPQVRRMGLGKFLLRALETRASQLGYKKVIIETASALDAACKMYITAGYETSNDDCMLKTKRCDMVLEKNICNLNPNEVHPGLLEIVDRTRGWRVASVTKSEMEKHRLLFRAAAVLVQQEGRLGGKVIVHRRSRNKKTYPGRMAALVTGCCDWGENPAETAKRETMEEVGIGGLYLEQPFEPFVADDNQGQRILFHPFVCTGEFEESDILCDPSEVESGFLMTREDIQAEGIGGSLWKEFRLHGL